jgi:hypothetical protein
VSRARWHAHSRRSAASNQPIIAAGAVALLTSCALIASCDLFIGNDSSLLHAAASLGTPYVGIVGLTSLASFHPLGHHPQQGTLVQPSPPCRRPQYFVGGALPWRRPCCRGTCRALAALRADAVLATAAVLLQRRFAHATKARRAAIGAPDKESAIGG